MSNTVVGELIEPNQPRDAIHIAVAPVVAAQTLAPGQHIGFTGEDTVHVMVVEPAMAVGIVDPFLTVNVLEGQACWMFLRPNTITSLRHDWTHPAFREDGPKRNVAASETWLRDFLAGNGPDYDQFMAAVNNGGEYTDPTSDYYNVRIDGEYVYVGGTDAHGEIPEEFWDHVEVVVGHKLPYRKVTHFSCSC